MNIKNRVSAFFLVVSSILALSGYAQPTGSLSGTVFEMNSDVPIAFVNIGIVGRNIGTVSDQNGRYTLQIPPQFHNDTLMFSYIGYHTYSVKVSDFLNLNNGNVSLAQREYELAELVVRPRGRVRERVLGIKAGGIMSNAIGYKFDAPGHEIGILISNNRTVFVKEVTLNVSSFHCDTAFFRINFYKPLGNMQFQNILRQPVYNTISKQDVKNGKITIDLRHHNLIIDHDFLVTYEHMYLRGGPGISFTVNSFRESYTRSISFGTWRIMSFGGISISVLVDVER